MVRPYAVHTLTSQQTPTNIGTQDYTVPGVGGTPIACVVIAARTTTNDATDQFGLSSSWGVSDGTNTYVHSTYSADLLSTSSAGQSTATDLLRIINPSGQAEGVVGEFDSFITNGVRIDFTKVNATTQFYFTVVLYFGTGTSCHAFWVDTPTVSASPTTVTCGFEPDYILTATANATTTGSNEASILTTYGVAINDGSDSMGSAGVYSADGVTTTKTYRPNHNNRLGTFLRLTTPLTIGGQVIIDNYASTSFDVSSTGPAFGPDLIGLAVGLPSSVSSTLEGNQSFESSTGASTRSGLGFLPGFWYTVHSQSTSINTIPVNGALALGVCDGEFNQAGIALTDRNNSSLSRTRTHFEEKIHSLDGQSGNDLERGEITARADGEYTVNVTSVAGIPRRYHILIVEELPFESTTTGGLSSMGSSVVAEELFDAEATAALSAMSVASVAELVVDAEATAGLSAMSASATAEELLDAEAAAALSAADASAVGEQELDAEATAALSAISTSAAAELLMDSEATAALSAMNASSAAVLLTDAAVTAGLSAASAAAVAEQLFDAVAAPTLPSSSASAEGDTTAPSTDASVQAALGAASASAVAEQVFEAVATAGAPAMVAAVEAELLLDSEISAGLSAVAASAEAELLLDAAITAGLGAVTADAESEVQFDAEIAAALAAMSVSIFDSPLLGADTNLLGSKNTRVDLVATKDTLAALIASKDTLVALSASSDTSVDLSASSEDIIDLGGTKA